MKRILAYKAKFEFLAGGTFGQGLMLVETGLDGSVWTVLAGKWNPSLNRDGPDGFLAGFRGGRRPT